MQTVQILLPSAQNSQMAPHTALVHPRKFSLHLGQESLINAIGAIIADTLPKDYRPCLTNSGPLHLSPTRENHVSGHYLGGTLPTHIRPLKGLEPRLFD